MTYLVVHVCSSLYRKALALRNARYVVTYLAFRGQNVNTQLYRINLQCADQRNSVWQHIQNSTEIKLNQKLDTLYQKLNKKLGTQTSANHTHQ